MTKLEKAFVRYMVETDSPLQSYKQAGYSQNMSDKAMRVQANKVLKRPSVALAIKELKNAADKAAREATIATVTERRQICTKGMRGELKDTIVTQYPDGKKVIIVRTAARGPFVTELNKMDGIYSDGARINLTVIQPKPIEDYTDEELDAIIEGRYKLLPEGGNNELAT